LTIAKSTTFRRALVTFCAGARREFELRDERGSEWVAASRHVIRGCFMDSWTNFRAVDVDRLAALCLARRRSLEEGSLRATCALLRTFSRPSLTKSELGKLEQRKARIARLKELDAPEVVVAHEERALDPYAYFSALANRTDLDASEVAAHAKDSLSMSFPFEYALGGGASDDEIVEWVLLPFDRRLWGFNDPEPEVVPALPQSIVGWPPEKARAVYYGQAVLSVDGEVPFPPLWRKRARGEVRPTQLHPTRSGGDLALVLPSRPRGPAPIPR
jgi:hypothetical protein